MKSGTPMEFFVLVNFSITMQWTLQFQLTNRVMANKNHMSTVEPYAWFYDTGIVIVASYPAIQAKKV